MFLFLLFFYKNAEKVNKFKKQLEEEEMASRNIRKLPGYWETRQSPAPQGSILDLAPVAFRVRVKLSANKPVREEMLWILDCSVHIEGTLFNLNHCKVQNTSLERSSCTSHFREWRFVYLLRKVIYCISYGEFTPQCENRFMIYDVTAVIWRVLVVTVSSFLCCELCS